MSGDVLIQIFFLLCTCFTWCLEQLLMFLETSSLFVCRLVVIYYIGLHNFIYLQWIDVITETPLLCELYVKLKHASLGFSGIKVVNKDILFQYYIYNMMIIKWHVVEVIKHNMLYACFPLLAHSDYLITQFQPGRQNSYIKILIFCHLSCQIWLYLTYPGTDFSRTHNKQCTSY